jgi:hypothetical protein
VNAEKLTRPVEDRFREILKGIPQQSQVQFSLEEQLQVAHLLCNYFGLYDAADYIRRKISR